MALILNVDFWFQKRDDRTVKHVRGDYIAPVDDEQREWLMRHDLVVDEGDISETIAKAVADVQPEPEPEPEPETNQDINRPRNGASETMWRQYAKSLGLDVTGLRKPEIIAVVRDHEDK